MKDGRVDNGGKRDGAGRPKKYGEKLVRMYIPKSLVQTVRKLLEKHVCPKG